jgi:nucleoside-diphosphate-sugar epimerase
VDEYLRYEIFDAVIHTAIKGGDRNKRDTFENTYLPNIQMFENLTSIVEPLHVPLIIFGSGAEFDRQTNINNCNEIDVFNRQPVDPYGLSKNIITRRMLSITNTYILRLFGCFNFDEDDTRFIKNSILNLKKGLPIEIHQNKYMDFFYLDDIFTVVNYILKNGGPKDINLVYKEKIDLMGIANLIKKHCGLLNPKIKLMNSKNGNDYTGCGTILNTLPIKLIGLSEGIFKTCKKLI